LNATGKDVLYEYLGYSYSALNNKILASRYLSKALEINPNNQSAKAALAGIPEQ